MIHAIVTCATMKRDTFTSLSAGQKANFLHSLERCNGKLITPESASPRIYGFPNDDLAKLFSQYISKI